MRPDTITLPQDLTTFIGHRKVMRDLLKTRCYAELDAALEALNLLHLSKNQRYWDYGLCLNSDFLFELPLQYVHERIAILDDWRNVTPSSYHQALYRAQLWDEVASTIRGTGWADDVSNAEWVGSALARDASMIAALQAIELHDRPLFAYRSLMTLSARFGEPAWLLKLAADEPPADYEQICTDYDRQDWEEGLALFGSLGGSLPTLPNALPTCLPPRKEHEFNVDKTYWLLRGLEAHPADLDLLNDYVCFLYPRWGGAHEEMQQFVDGPLCTSLAPQARNHLKVTKAWDTLSRTSLSPDDVGGYAALHAEVERLLTLDLDEGTRAAICRLDAQFLASEAKDPVAFRLHETSGGPRQ